MIEQWVKTQRGLDEDRDKDRDEEGDQNHRSTP